MFQPPVVSEALASLLVWGLLGGAACVAGVVSLLIAWLGRPSGMLIGGAVLGVGLAMLITLGWLIPRYWFVAVPPVALGVQTLRTWRAHPLPNRWTFRLDTFALLVVALSLLTAGGVSLRRQIQHQRAIGAKIEAGGGYIVEEFDGTIRAALVRNATSDTLDSLTPLIVQLPSLRQLSLDGTPCSNTILRKLSACRTVAALQLQGSQLKPGWAAAVAEFRGLRILDLIGATGVTDEELKRLQQMDGLRRIYLGRTGATRQGIQSLQESLPQAEVAR